MKKIIFALLLSLLLSFVTAYMYAGQHIWHRTSQTKYTELENGDIYYILPDDFGDESPIEKWARYTKGKNDAPEVIACNGNKKLLKFITVYINERLDYDSYNAENNVDDQPKVSTSSDDEDNDNENSQEEMSSYGLFNNNTIINIR